MTLRTPLAVTVVGTLLIGGAATGTTLAVWADQATMDSSRVTAGELTVSVRNAGETSASLGPIEPLVPGGNPVTVSAVIRNTSPSAAKNLRINVRASSVAVAVSPAPTTGFTLANIQMDIQRRTAATCPTLQATDLREAVGYSTEFLNGSPLTAGQTVPICVTVAAKSGMPYSGSGTLNLTFEGVQVP